ncbi:hypothetical protein TNCV_4948991 [Trichonephila clavipes]|nr:hypothetical protein TNCV_4948991 [Trichonephila clavipes]
MELQQWSRIELALLPCAVMMRKFPVLSVIIAVSPSAGIVCAIQSNDIMQIDFKIVNSIHSRSLQRRQFQAFLEEAESEYGNLLL